MTRELASRHALFKQFIQLPQAPPLRLRDKEEDPDRQYSVAATPDIAVLRAPVQRIRIDEVRRTELTQPTEDEIDAVRKSNGLCTESLGTALPRQ